MSTYMRLGRLRLNDYCLQVSKVVLVLLEGDWTINLELAPDTQSAVVPHWYIQTDLSKKVALPQVNPSICRYVYLFFARADLTDKIFNWIVYGPANFPSMFKFQRMIQPILARNSKSTSMYKIPIQSRLMFRSISYCIQGRRTRVSTTSQTMSFHYQMLIFDWVDLQTMKFWSMS